MSGASIEELERQIEETRQDLDRTLEALRCELSPRRQWEQAWHFAKRRTGRSLRTGASWSINHPVPALLAAAAMTAALCFSIEKRRQRS